ncbi:hypothetical protein C2G38_149562 [Gigaspora rosea]|uniref:Uncharacterized protein n=1 Tax=Gigaspora rosea TaxID=44941 RepID=A0A397W8T8_9GLOM|nr:hypothetical protein C2G38_149562 [Gigaspora rosea]
MMESKKAIIVATIFSFISLISLSLVNLGTPVIQPISLITIIYKSLSIDSSDSITYFIRIGIYGTCMSDSSSTSGCSHSDIDSDIQLKIGNYPSQSGYLLFMHPIGLFVSFFLVIISFSICLNYIRGQDYRRLISNSLISSTIVNLMAIIGDILIFKYFSDTYGDGTTTFGSGFALVFVSFICTLFSTFAFYKAGILSHPL